MNILVDDDDPLVQYLSGWRSAGHAPEFNGTTHASVTLGKPATLTFEGTSIMVFGTVRDNGQAKMNFTIDNGGTSGSFDIPELSRSGPIHNKLFWTSPALEEAAHTLSIIVDHDSNLDNEQTLFLDYFVYTTTSTARKSVLIDDSDTRVTYSQDWDAQNNSDASLERTQHVSTSGGAWVSLTFEGTQISLIGTGSVASVVIDGSPWAAAPQPQGSVPLFQSSVLPQATHTMNITLDGNSMGIDYFLVTTELDNLPVSVSTSGPTASPLSPPASQSSPPVSSSLVPTPTVSQISKTVKPTPVGATIGGAMGGLVLIALVLAFTIIRGRRALAPLNNNQPVLPAIPRWMGWNTQDQSITVARPFLPSLNERAREGPPPYTLKYLSVV
ncbi:hypothetical protein MVEN_01705700 [Mycena venus]|uniref:Transmembrane protein n=1 Tax=Mycena venus TaxID=2733690 RepID=A0A8H7CND4_9AGAR|nr:hypothetical protein MVEN_01705700 [Mycena venus]